MHSRELTGLARFRDEVSRLSKYWRSVDWRTTAVRVGDTWFNIGTRVYLDSRPRDQVPRYSELPSAPNLLLLQDVQDVAGFDSQLVELQKGCVEISGKPLQFMSLPKDGRRVEPYQFDYRFSDLGGFYNREYEGWSSLQCLGYGSTIWQLCGSQFARDALDNDLRVDEAPYDGLADLEVHFLGKLHPSSTGTMAGCELFAPLQIRLDQSSTRLESGTLTVCLVANDRALLDGSRIAFFGVSARQFPTQMTFGPQDIQSTTGRPPWMATTVIDVGDHAYGKVFIQWEGFCVDRMTVYDLARPAANVRQRAYQVVDPGEEILGTSLKPRTAGSRNHFEGAVARLFTLLGYQVSSFFGDKRLSESVDFLAHEPFRPVVMPVECTTGTASSRGKLGRLVLRAESFREAMPEAEVIPVLVTSAPVSQLPKGDLLAAAQDRVALIGEEGLNAIYQQLHEGSAIDAVTSRIIGLIPSLEGQALGRRP